MTHKEQIIAWIQSHGSITNRDAAREFECYRLSARILDLRADGVPIVTVIETNPETQKRYARYFLET